MSDADFADRAVLGALLEAHPRLLDVHALAAELTDVEGVQESVALGADGLARRLGDRVGATRAAARFDALGL